MPYHSSANAFLMCPPTYFDVRYEINPWMKKQNPVDPKRANREFERLTALYKKYGAKVVLMRPHKEYPDLVFTANGAFIWKDRAVLASFRYKERQGETPLFEKWFETHAYRPVRMPAGTFLEGQGEAFAVGERVFAGYGFRANKKSHAFLKDVCGVPVVSLKQVDPYWYHLDTCFCPLPENTVLYYPGAFDAAAQKNIEKYTRAIRVEKQEALDFVCNSVPLGNLFITGAHPSERTKAALKSLGYRIVQTPLQEFKKSGGGARCLTLNLKNPA